MYDEKRPEKTKDYFIVSNLSCERIISNFIDRKYTFHKDTSSALISETYIDRCGIAVVCVKEFSDFCHGITKL